MGRLNLGISLLIWYICFLTLVVGLLLQSNVNGKSELELFCNFSLNYMSLPKVLGGMRGMTGLLWETSLLDPDEV